jgi:hypothetical protein
LDKKPGFFVRGIIFVDKSAASAFVYKRHCQFEFFLRGFFVL